MLPILITLENSMNRHMQQIDHQTGEVVEENFVAYVQSAKTDFRKDGWQWLRSNDACSKQFNRQRHEGYVGNACPATDYENLIQVNQAEVSEQVGMNRHNVNRSIKKLI